MRAVGLSRYRPATGPSPLRVSGRTKTCASFRLPAGRAVLKGKMASSGSTTMAGFCADRWSRSVRWHGAARAGAPSFEKGSIDRDVGLAFGRLTFRAAFAVELGIAFVFITQELPVVRDFADRVLGMT